MYNSNIEQLGICSIELRYKDKVGICRFFVVPDDSKMLLRMSDIGLLGIWKIMCKVV